MQTPCKRLVACALLYDLRMLQRRCTRIVGVLGGVLAYAIALNASAQTAPNEATTNGDFAMTRGFVLGTSLSVAPSNPLGNVSPLLSFGYKTNRLIASLGFEVISQYDLEEHSAAFPSSWPENTANTSTTYDRTLYLVQPEIQVAIVQWESVATEFFGKAVGDFGYLPKERAMALGFQLAPGFRHWFHRQGAISGTVGLDTMMVFKNSNDYHTSFSPRFELQFLAVF